MVSPLPPSRTGIADYTVDVVRALGSDHAIDLFHDQAEVAASLPAPSYRIDTLPSRHEAAPYEAIVYQMGNGPAHDFMYPWMEKVRGAVVLHDLVLHHSFARRFLASPESLAYAADPSSEQRRAAAERQHRRYQIEVDRAYPGRGEQLKDAYFNSAGDLLPFAFPLFEPALRHARAAGAHNSFMVEAMSAAFPGLACTEVVHPAEPVDVDPERVAVLRQKLGLVEADRVVGCFGLLTREKRLDTVARAIARIAPLHPRLKLLLAGPVGAAEWLLRVVKEAGVQNRTLVVGRLEPGDFAAAMSLSHVVVHLRYPTARETSGALLRVLAQGRPTIIADLANQSAIPDDAVKRVDLCDEEGDLSRALNLLIRNASMARAMGERARQFALRHHGVARTRESYDRLLKSQGPLYPQAAP